MIIAIVGGLLVPCHPASLPDLVSPLRFVWSGLRAIIGRRRGGLIRSNPDLVFL
jgi:hypothetical protein